MSTTKQIKCVLIGDGNVGKTSFVKRCFNRGFATDEESTMGVEVRPITLTDTAGQNPDLCFNIWDTAGRDEFGGLRDGYYINADCVILFFDVTDKHSFDKLINWYNSFYKVACVKDFKTVIVANKVDAENRVVTKADIEGNLLCQRFKVCEMSCKTGDGINEPLTYLMSVV